MSTNEIQTNNVNGSRLAEQGPSSGRCSRQGNIGRHHANLVISKRRKFKTHSITKTNELFYAGAFGVTNKLGVKIDKVAGRKEPMWKRRLQNKIKEPRKDLSQLEASKDKGVSNSRHWERLERKYSIRVKRLNVVVEELKQRITGIAAKV